VAVAIGLENAIRLAPWASRRLRRRAFGGADGGRLPHQAPFWRGMEQSTGWGGRAGSRAIEVEATHRPVKGGPRESDVMNRLGIGAIGELAPLHGSRHREQVLVLNASLRARSHHQLAPAPL